MRSNDEALCELRRASTAGGETMDRHIAAVNYIHELLNCSELNMDDMEPETVELIEAIYD